MFYNTKHFNLYQNVKKNHYLLISGYEGERHKNYTPYILACFASKKINFSFGNAEKPF
jgi:hypothetical protein